VTPEQEAKCREAVSDYLRDTANGQGNLGYTRGDVKAAFAAGAAWQAAQQKVDTASLEAVAKSAALCCIDLRTNLRDAKQEWMDGTIARGAYEYVQSRHDDLHAALHSAGFTDTNKLFGFPVRPAPPEQPSSEEGDQ
jgi:hypothetical protein